MNTNHSSDNSDNESRQKNVLHNGVMTPFETPKWNIEVDFGEEEGAIVSLAPRSLVCSFSCFAPSPVEPKLLEPAVQRTSAKANENRQLPCSCKNPRSFATTSSRREQAVRHESGVSAEFATSRRRPTPFP